MTSSDPRLRADFRLDIQVSCGAFDASHFISVADAIAATKQNSGFNDRNSLLLCQDMSILVTSQVSIAGGIVLGILIRDFERHAPFVLSSEREAMAFFTLKLLGCHKKYSKATHKWRQRQ